MKRVGTIVRGDTDVLGPGPILGIRWDDPNEARRLVEGTRVYVAETRGPVSTKPKRPLYVVTLVRGRLGDLTWEHRDRRDARLRYDGLMQLLSPHAYGVVDVVEYKIMAQKFFEGEAE